MCELPKSWCYEIEFCAVNAKFKLVWKRCGSILDENVLYFNERIVVVT